MATSTLPRISTGPKKVKFFNEQLTKNTIVFAFFHRFVSSCLQIPTNQIFAVLSLFACGQGRKKFKTEDFNKTTKASLFF
jgi:hypothetical protein